MRQFLFALTMFLAVFARAMASDAPCPPTKERREWSAACFEEAHGIRKIKQQHLQSVEFDNKGYAAIVITVPPELVAVNRQGKVVRVNEARLSGFSFEPGDGYSGIARFGYVVPDAKIRHQFKCGYYQLRPFRILAPPRYDYCDGFNEGTALVCFGCINHCEDGDCHVPHLINGEALVINEKNEVIRKIELPSLPLQ